MTAYLLELCLTWFKKYYPLFANYTSAFISFLNCSFSPLNLSGVKWHLKLSNCTAKKSSNRKLFKYCCRLRGTYCKRKLIQSVFKGTRSPMKDIIAVKWCCLLEILLVATLLSCVNRYQCPTPIEKRQQNALFRDNLVIRLVRVYLWKENLRFK